jgi:hypothetical protein
MARTCAAGAARCTLGAMSDAESIKANQKEFSRLTPPSGESPELERILGAKSGTVRWYKTDVDNPSQQLKNKLSQAADVPDGLLVLTVAGATAHERGRATLVENWGANPGWTKTGVACVALAYDGAIRSIVVWKKSSFPERITSRLAPDAEVLEAVRPREPDSIDTSGDPRALAELLCVDESHVLDWLWLIEKQRALIFYGPPGTGKTFIARRLAEHLQQRPELRRLVQLHPSYGYEEFFEGYRPLGDDVSDAPGLRLAKQDGPLRDLARRAIAEPNETAVMLLDEVNRGNLPRVFGELYFLIEYRNAEVSLMYSPSERFALPKKLTFIGTMNTADRSVAVLDQALRRRFHFVPLFPGEPPIDGMLRRYLAKNCPNMAYVADLLDLANEQLPRHFRIGPSHLMRVDLEESLERIWKYSVLPSIAEQFFDREAEMNETLSLDALRRSLAQRQSGS